MPASKCWLAGRSSSTQPRHEAPQRNPGNEELGGSSGRLRWRRSRGLYNGVAALVDTRVAFAEAGHHFVADGAEMVGEFVDRNAFADQRHHMTAPHGILVEIGDVDGRQ